MGARERVTDTHLLHVREETLPCLCRPVREGRGARARGRLRRRRAALRSRLHDGVVPVGAQHAATTRLRRRSRRRACACRARCSRRRAPRPRDAYRRRRAPAGRRGRPGRLHLRRRGGVRRRARARGRRLPVAVGGRQVRGRAPAAKRGRRPPTRTRARAAPRPCPRCAPTEAGPFGRHLPTAAIRRAVRGAGLATPIVAAGGITTFSLAEAALARGDADFVASARQSLADPDWFEKVRLGRGGEIRRCQLTNYCEALDQRHKAVTCQLWDHPEGAPRRLIAPAWTAEDAPQRSSS